MSTILNIRGTNGSGKSTSVRLLMERLGERKPFFLDEKETGYQFESPQGKLFVLGKYTTDCGGLDSSFSYKGAADDVINILGTLAKRGHVVAEGVVAMSSYGFGRLSNFATDMESKGHHVIFALIDTPLDVCISRCEKRRRDKAAAKGKEPKPLDPSNLADKWNGTHKDQKRLQEAGFDCRFLNHQDPLPQILDWLQLPKE